MSENPNIFSGIPKTAESELQRRWKALNVEMEKEGIDAIVAYNAGDQFQSAARYITDVSYTHFPYGCMLGKNADIAFVSNGTPMDGSGFRDYQKYYQLDNFDVCIGQPGLPTFHFTDNYMAERLSKFVKKHNYKRIGIANRQILPVSIYQYFLDNIPGIEFVDAGPIVNQVMAVKSEYEIEELYKPCAEMLDRIYQFIPSFIRPGRSCFDVAVDIKELCTRNGVLWPLVMIGADKSRPFIVPNHYTNYTIMPDDIVQILIEMPNAAGVWGEVARQFYFDDADPETVKANKDSFEIMQLCAAKAKSGTTINEVQRYKAQLLDERGYYPDPAFDIHGSGYSACEIPVGMFDYSDDTVLKENMWVAIHPTCVNDKAAAFNCDNFLITKDGGTRITQTPMKMYQCHIQV